jgi:hypothetical protein
MDRLGRLLPALIAATLFTEAAAEVVEPGRLEGFRSRQALTRAFDALIAEGQDCEQMLQVISIRIIPRPRRSLFRLDGIPEAVQEATVVKRIGNHLAILHRQRLFTIAIGAGTLRQVDVIEARTSESEAFDRTDYQELLVIGDRLVLTGSAGDGTVEIASFRMDASGGLHPEGAWLLLSPSACIGPSYHARAIGKKLVIFSSHEMDATDEVDALMPGLTRWPMEEPRYRPTATPRDVYRRRLAGDAGEGNVLHTVSVCEFGSRTLNCQSTALIGVHATAHVSKEALYLMSESALDPDAPQGILYRVPYDGSEPSRTLVAGAVRDDFSFRSERGQIEVLVSGQPSDERFSAALLRVPIASLATTQRVSPTRYRMLPAPADGIGANRFVGKHLFYSSSLPDIEPTASQLTAVDLETGVPTQLTLPFTIEEIHPAGTIALVVGNTHTQEKVALGGVDVAASPTLGWMHTSPSHDFSLHEQLSVLGAISAVPLQRERSAESDYLPYVASMMFFANDSRGFVALGELRSNERDVSDDRCTTGPCTDWFEDSRAFAIGDRLFALLGYELIEAKLEAGKLLEVRRLHFGPPDIFWPQDDRS